MKAGGFFFYSNSIREVVYVLSDFLDGFGFFVLLFLSEIEEKHSDCDEDNPKNQLQSIEAFGN